MKKEILLHACCGPCSTYPIEKLQEDGYTPIVYFYNPCIHPHKEYILRLEEARRYAEIKNVQFIEEIYNDKEWFKLTKDFQEAPEGGARCNLCFDMRLKLCAQYAKEHKIPYITTTLSVSPHKNHPNICAIGNKAAEEYEVTFLEYNFKKEDGYRKSILISKEHGLYRQNYCGCTYSMRTKDQ